jgi:uncharacterized glyoxalase superfamily protein PhnB
VWVTYTNLEPMLITSDMGATIAFYRDVLGFEVTATLPDDQNPFWCRMSSGPIAIMFSFDETHTHDDGEVHVVEPGLTGTLYINPQDVASLYERVKEKAPVSPLQLMDYGMREFHMTDPNGYTLTFGQSAD